MSFQRKVSPCGRPIEKPKEEQSLQKNDLVEESMPINQQIENLKTKISIKERYNNVLKEELEENRQGASSIIKDLLAETLNLRHELINAVGREGFAVQNALRTHRLFQLALRENTPESAITWLDDKLFDNAKALNEIVERLINKRRKLHECEKVVTEIEKWPRPGTLPWEKNMVHKCDFLQIAASSVAVKLEASRILNTKYLEIKDKLRDEERLYQPNINLLQSQLNYQSEELRALQNMLDEAQMFEQDAEISLAEIENEASQNRKKRRVQMGKIKKAVEKVLQANDFASIKKETKRPTIPKQSLDAASANDSVHKYSSDLSSLNKSNISQLDLQERLAMKRAEVEKLQRLVFKVVSTMRVPDLTHIPNRLNTVIAVAKALTAEKNSKESLRNLLVHQRDQMLLLYNQLHYTGAQEQTHFQEVLEDYNKTLQGTLREVNQIRMNSDRMGSKLIDIRLGISSLLGRLDEGKSYKINAIKNTNELILVLPIVQEKIRQLVSSVENLQRLFKVETNKDYSQGVRKNPGYKRHVRVGTPQLSEGSDGEDYDDFKVPTYADIKAKSQKLVQQSIFIKKFGID